MSGYNFRYRYKGPVTRFGRFYGTYEGITEVPVTSTNPEKRALNNFAYKCKTENNLASTAKIEFDAKYLTFIGKYFKYT